MVSISSENCEIIEESTVKLFIPYYRITHYDLNGDDIDSQIIDYQYEVSNILKEMKEYLAGFDDDDLKEISYFEIEIQYDEQYADTLFEIPVNPIKEEEKEEKEEETIMVKKIEIEGVWYYIDEDNIIYDTKTHDPVGIYNTETKTINRDIVCEE